MRKSPFLQEKQETINILKAKKKKKQHVNCVNCNHNPLYLL